MATSRALSSFSDFTLRLVAAGGIAAASLLPFLAAPALTPRVAAISGCPALSGYVYVDINNNGIMDGGETPIAGVPMDLKDESGVVISSTATDAAGFYRFTSDQSARTPEQTQVYNATFPTAITDWTAGRAIPAFDPALGVLNTVELRVSGVITSAIKAESLDSDAQHITATVSGTVSITGPGGAQAAAIPLLEAGTFDASAYDGVSDFAGASGHDFGSHSASDARSFSITGAATAPYVGTGTVTVNVAAAASSRTTGSGNVLNQINTTASAETSVTYRFSPPVCIKPGRYTVVERVQPPAYADGQETAGNITPIPNTVGSDFINVTVTTEDVPNNNFGEIPGSLQGYVFVDSVQSCTRAPSKPVIAGVLITLTGTDVNGNPVSRTTTTGADGSYRFDNLLAGTYVLAETQPPGYLDGADAIGTPGGTQSNDRFSDIRLQPGYRGVENDFCEVPAPTPTPTATPTTPTVTETVAGTRTPGRTPTGTVTPIESVAGARTPGPPGTGNGGIFSKSASPTNLALAAVVLISVASWLAFMVMRRMDNGPEIGEE